MDKIIRSKLPIRREEVTREEARRRILAQEEPYKLEILESIPATEPISIYHIGDQWWDLCAGPHVESTGSINSDAISLQSVAGAYWKGDEKNAMLQVSLPSSLSPDGQSFRESTEPLGRRQHNSLTIRNFSRNRRPATIGRLERNSISSQSKKRQEAAWSFGTAKEPS